MMVQFISRLFLNRGFCESLKKFNFKKSLQIEALIFYQNFAKNKIMNNQNPFAALNLIKEHISENEAYDREIQRLREERMRFGMFIKEREQRLNEERKRRNPGD